MAFAGLGYLALWLCAKLGVAIPYLTPQTPVQSSGSGSFLPIARQRGPLRTVAAAPPTYLIVFPLTSIGGAIYISSSRYSDFMHHGFDVFTSAILGLITAWLGFRWYHMPIRQGGGWAWAPRSPKRAFGKSMGKVTYGQDSASAAKDPEAGAIFNRQSLPSSHLQTARREEGDSSGRSYEMNPFPPTNVPAPAGVTADGSGQTRGV